MSPFSETFDLQTFYSVGNAPRHALTHAHNLQISLDTLPPPALRPDDKVYSQGACAEKDGGGSVETDASAKPTSWTADTCPIG